LDTLLSDQVGGSSRRSKARDSARRSVTGFCSESARVRITARSLRVEDEPSAGKRSPSQFAYNGFVEGEPSPVQIEVDHGRKNPDETLLV